jgi:hypothetical protein
MYEDAHLEMQYEDRYVADEFIAPRGSFLRTDNEVYQARSSFDPYEGDGWYDDDEWFDHDVFDELYD